MRKSCISCGIRKSLAEFYRHPRMADGRLNKCKECQKRDVKAARAHNAEHYNEYEVSRRNLPHRKAARAAYAASPAGRATHDKAVATYRERNPLKYKAHNAINNAVRDGRLVKPKRCSTCRKVRTLQAHHDDYRQPLVVRWLCIECHNAEHV